jgi:hypothetical protein
LNSILTFQIKIYIFFIVDNIFFRNFWMRIIIYYWRIFQIIILNLTILGKAGYFVNTIFWIKIIIFGWLFLTKTRKSITIILRSVLNRVVRYFLRCHKLDIIHLIKKSRIFVRWFNWLFSNHIFELVNYFHIFTVWGELNSQMMRRIHNTHYITFLLVIN